LLGGKLKTVLFFALYYQYWLLGFLARVRVLVGKLRIFHLDYVALTLGVTLGLIYLNIHVTKFGGSI